MKISVSFPEGLKDQFLQEIHELGIEPKNTSKRIMFFEVDINSFYRICLNTRISYKVSREIARFHCDDRISLYKGIQEAVDWKLWLPPHKSFRIEVTGKTGKLNHSHFSALQAKNSIIDFQRNLWGKRSNVSIDSPDIPISIHLYDGQAVVSLQADKNSLHKRGYKLSQGDAPLKENIASGLIKMTGWNGSVPLIDLMSGSGTFLIEAAQIALKIAPNLNKDFSFKNWFDYNNSKFIAEKNRVIKTQLLEEKFLYIHGCEINHRVYLGAKRNINNVKLENIIRLSNQNFINFLPPSTKGIAVVNPPYGKRMSDTESLKDLYDQLGKYAKKYLSGWDLWILSGSSELTQYLHLKCSRKFNIYNGGINCKWLRYRIN
tara:strand:+ start:19473 stop:20597 length:1125 start_codon:yes stop_codon:yes gene_type:complete